MIKFLTTKRLEAVLNSIRAKISLNTDGKGLAIKFALGCLLFGLTVSFLRAYQTYDETSVEIQRALELTDPSAQGVTGLALLPPVFPLVGKGIAVFLSLVGFVISLLIRYRAASASRREKLIVIAFWFAALAGLMSWLPTDILETQAAISGKALAGETPSIPVYIGKLALVGLLILSAPIVAMYYYRLRLMDQYVVRSFLSPFSLCMFAFVAIWIIAGLTDDGPLLASMTPAQLASLYLAQIPFVILFVMPIVFLLAGLFTLSNMSRANELITMIGTGRSVTRVLMPLFITAAYASLVCLALKYEWAPQSEGYKEAVLITAYQEKHAKLAGQEPTKDIWAKRGWMYVNKVDRRTWFVGAVPLKLSDPMADIVIWEMDDSGQPITIWKAARARWIWDASPPEWVFTGVTIYNYEKDHIPRIENRRAMRITGWKETPWGVLSSSQDPSYLGMQGLTMYLNANEDSDAIGTAPFRTNRFYIFAEPASCFVMLLVAAPLGVVYSRRGAIGGVAGAIGIFAMMYIMRGTLLAMGQSNRISPMFAAWGTNLIISIIGLCLLWFRARNRELPKISEIFRFRRTGSTVS